MFGQVIKDYSNVSPDAWNPLKSDLELWHRLRLFFEMKQAFQFLPKPLDQMRVLDIGCGVGRSTRALLEFGFSPENLVGVDILKDVIDNAKKLNPGIKFVFIETLDDFYRLGDFDLCCQCTVFSSIKDQGERRTLAETMTASLNEDGYIFWWDRRHANDFAGGDVLLPEKYFQGLKLLYKAEVPLKWEPRRCIRPLRGLRRFIVPLVDRIGYPATHVAALFRGNTKGIDE